MIQKADKLWIGIIIGTMIPIGILLAIYLAEHIEGSFFKFLADMFSSRLLSAFLRIGLMGNLAIFLLFFYTGFNQLPKGILASTIGYGLFIVYMYIW